MQYSKKEFISYFNKDIRIDVVTRFVILTESFLRKINSVY